MQCEPWIAEEKMFSDLHEEGKILPPVMASDSLIYFPVPSNSVLEELINMIVTCSISRKNESSEDATYRTLC